MPASSTSQAYSPREIAQAAGLATEDVLGALRSLGLSEASSSQQLFLPHDRALLVARAALRARRTQPAGPPTPLFSIVSQQAGARPATLPLALSGSIHGLALVMAIWVTTLGLRSSAQTVIEEPHESARLVFLMTPGPGGGGGGGGLRQKLPPPAAKQQGEKKIGNPLPVRRTAPAEPISTPPEPKVLPAEPLPPIVAPVVAAAPDPVTRPGTLEPTKSEADSHGAGTGGGVGTGTGVGIGEGDGAGLGPGSGGGTGGGPYRPGSGIEPPRLIREVKPDYTDEARRRNVEGEVELEIVVKRDGTVGNVRVLRGLAAGLNDRAIDAVRQWRFAPAKRFGTPVDVIVQVGVEFRQR
jgi:TonB family protein